MTGKDGLPSNKKTGSGVDAFLRQVAVAPRRTPSNEGGRLLFAMDATASRQPTWDRAARLQGEMFEVARELGGLDIQLGFFRGFGEFKVSPWTADAGALLKLMTSVNCLAGETQISKIFKHARNETSKRKIDALVYVGDSFEEDVDEVGKIAGELGLLGLPAFMFHEGEDPLAGFAFQQFAKLSGGGYCRFDAASADALRELLRAVAVFAAGGRRALENLATNAGGEVKLLADQMKT